MLDLTSRCTVDRIYIYYYTIFYHDLGRSNIFVNFEKKIVVVLMKWISIIEH